MGNRLFALRYLFTTCCVLALTLSPLNSGSAPAADPPGSNAYKAAVDAMNRGNYQAALEEIQQAIMLEPGNLDLQYTLGGIYLRMNKSEAARIIFETLLTADPVKYKRAYFDLAWAFMQMGEEANALAMFKEARDVDPGQADFEMGTIHLRNKEYEKAARLFNQARIEKPALASEAMAREAVALYHIKDFNKSKELLDKLSVLKFTPEREKEIKDLLAAVDAAIQASKPWQITAILGVQYDDNLYLSPLEKIGLESIPSGVRNQSDFAFLTSLIGRYNIIQSDPWKFGVGYNHYQLMYAEHSALSLIGARPSLYAQWLQPPYYANLDYVFSHFWVDNEPRVNVHSLYPRFAVQHTDRLRSEAYGVVEWRLNLDDSPNSRFYSMGLMEMYLFMKGKAHVRAGYQFSFEDLVPHERADNVWHEVMVGTLCPIWNTKWSADLSFRQLWRDFRFDPLISTTTRRSDSQQNLALVVYRPLTRNLVLSFLAQEIWNDSNISAFVGDFSSYDPYHFRRTVASCMLTLNW